MDRLFLDIIGKANSDIVPTSKIITVIAENFSLLDDQSKFLRALLAIPNERKLQTISKKLVQISHTHKAVQDQLEKCEWNVISADELLHTTVSDRSIYEDLDSRISGATRRSLIVLNDASSLQLVLGGERNLKPLLRVFDKWKRLANHSVIVLYQQSQPAPASTFLRDLEAISDACVRARSFKSNYLLHIWRQPNPSVKSMIPPKVETEYSTCRIDKSLWSPDLLCFRDYKKVDKNFDPDLADATGNFEPSKVVDPNMSEIPAIKEENSDDESPEGALHRLGLNATNEDEDDPNTDIKPPTLPYIRAQNPEQSRIFYYPDKDDDVDEDDPDDDLGI